VRYPDHVYLLRGGKDNASMSRLYGLYDECKTYGSVRSWKLLVSTFQCLPLAAVIDDRVPTAFSRPERSAYGRAIDW
jgi:serine/threonine-protein phosphatase PP1 catalytic subunit